MLILTIPRTQKLRCILSMVLWQFSMNLDPASRELSDANFPLVQVHEALQKRGLLTQVGLLLILAVGGVTRHLVPEDVLFIRLLAQPGLDFIGLTEVL